MHDIKSIRDDPQAFDEGLKRRGLAPMSADILKADGELRAVLTRLQQAQARRNEASKLIGHAKAKKDEAQVSALMAEVAGLKDEIQKGEEGERRLKEQLDKKLAEIPNLPAADVPVGPDESANVELRRWSEKPGIPFKPKEHYELGEGVGQMDFEAAARMSGARFVVLKKGLARLERAIAQFMLDLHTEQFGYTEISPPLLVRDEAMFGTGQLPKFEDDLFLALSGRETEIVAASAYVRALEEARRLELDDNKDALRPLWEAALKSEPKYQRRWLVPTAEVPLTNLVREQILDEKQLPLRFTAFTPCFRSEAGAAGKDTRGMIRMHQFDKVELVSITAPEKSKEEHERMTDCAQEIL
ncbi:MAG TPA: serine--tRNA ligase, partial [Micropepsaceae bacterium]|nr:serine--tRNA ligase [Micropepsaceae bacterium]